MAQQTWKIRSWNCDTQQYDAEREVTLAQYLAEHKASCEKAKAKYHADCFLMATTNLS